VLADAGLSTIASHLDGMNRTRSVVLVVVQNRYVLRDGQVMFSTHQPEGLEVLTYRSAVNEQTHLLLTDTAEVTFLMRCREDVHHRFV
tara:strand:- start:869 stop:1132 length:264 start_codon:yes stop_codon:yes gene_type:complete